MYSENSQEIPEFSIVGGMNPIPLMVEDGSTSMDWTAVVVELTSARELAAEAGGSEE